MCGSWNDYTDAVETVEVSVDTSYIVEADTGTVTVTGPGEDKVIYTVERLREDEWTESPVRGVASEVQLAAIHSAERLIDEALWSVDENRPLGARINRFELQHAA